MAANLKAILDRATHSALDFLLPMRCLGCGREGGLLCEPCIAALPRLEPPYCERCAAGGVVGECRYCREQARQWGRPLDGLRAPYLFQGAVRDVVHRFKYENARAAASLLGRLMSDYLAANPLPGDRLMPVPLHPAKLRERGYNQAELLAKEVGKTVGLPVDAKLLYRARNTPAQVRAVNRQQRIANTADAFAIRGSADGQSIILIDDVSTTGSTLTAAAAALKQAGAESVWALVLAREERHSPAAADEERFEQ